MTMLRAFGLGVLAAAVGCASSQPPPTFQPSRSAELPGLAPMPIPEEKQEQEQGPPAAAEAPEQPAPGADEATPPASAEAPVTLTDVSKEPPKATPKVTPKVTQKTATPKATPKETPPPAREEPAAAVPPEAAEAAAAVPVSIPCTTLLHGAVRRSALAHTLDAGLGAWLRGVDLDPYVDGGRFKGWVFRGVRAGDPCWSEVELQSGDVVTRINRHPIQRPDQAQIIWTALRGAREIVVDYLRDGKPHTLRFPVVDDRK